MAPESVNLSQSLSPHQTFTPINKLQEVSPYVSVISKDSMAINRIACSEPQRQAVEAYGNEVPSQVRPRL